MNWDFAAMEEAFQADLSALKDLKGVEDLRVKYLGRKGEFAQIYAAFPSMSAEDRAAAGKQANTLRKTVEAQLEEYRARLEAQAQSQSRPAFDLTLPGVAPEYGHQHLLTTVLEEICGIFEQLGFSVQDGPEMETEFHNFTALNIPVDHPSRDAFDTFYLDAKDPDRKDRFLLLRSHTSPGQIRIMEQFKPPLAVVIPGKVYRPDAVDASHSFMFHQVEGLLIDEDVKFSDLKGLLTSFCQRLFGENIRMRFRPHFFPFTEPSAEVDISCYMCDGKGCAVCGRKGWLEILGCGMVHPKVFEAVKYPKGKYTGLAFGLGVERIAMLKYGINDIRMFYDNDLRFLRQF